LDEHRDSAAKQFASLKDRWQALRPSAARQKVATFYTYKKPDDVSVDSVRSALENLRKMACQLRAKQPNPKNALTKKDIFDHILRAWPERAELDKLRDKIRRGKQQKFEDSATWIRFGSLVR
jgi:hypothetical protein